MYMALPEWIRRARDGVDCDTKLYRKAKGLPTVPDGSQITVEATQFDRYGRPVVVVADEMVVVGEVQGWLAIGRLLGPLKDEKRGWVFFRPKRRARKPTIIGEKR